MRSDPRPPVFSAGAAGRALVLVCEQVGLDARRHLIRRGENAIYRLASAPVVVRVARSTSCCPTSARRWPWPAGWTLRALGDPAQRCREQALIADGRPVTLWELVDAVPPEPIFAELGEMLRRLHELTEPPGFGLPPL
jgi:hypothetical protein